MTNVKNSVKTKSGKVNKESAGVLTTINNNNDKGKAMARDSMELDWMD